MTRPTRIAIAVLSVLLAGSIALLVWVYVSDRAAAAEWALKDQARIQERNEALREAAKAHAAAVAAVVAKHAKEKAELETEIAEAVKVRKSRPRPTTLKACTDQLAERDHEIDLRVRQAALDWLTIQALKDGIAHETRRGDILEAVLQDEIDRADGWREYARKSKRRDRVKLAFVGIGSAIGGGLAGYGIGAAR